MEGLFHGPDYSIYRVKVQVHQVPDTVQYWCEVRAGPQMTAYPGPQEDQGGPGIQTCIRALPGGTRGFPMWGLSPAQSHRNRDLPSSPPACREGRGTQASHLCWQSRGKHFGCPCVL